MSREESFYINLGSMTQAIRAEKILKSKNIESAVAKNSDILNSNGCSWGVWVKGISRENAINILRIGSVNVL